MKISIQRVNVTEYTDNPLVKVIVTEGEGGGVRKKGMKEESIISISSHHCHQMGGGDERTKNVK